LTIRGFLRLGLTINQVPQLCVELQAFRILCRLRCSIAVSLEEECTGGSGGGLGRDDKALERLGSGDASKDGVFEDKASAGEGTSKLVEL
jgi:hypothetical protein